MYRIFLRSRLLIVCNLTYSEANHVLNCMKYEPKEILNIKSNGLDYYFAAEEVSYVVYDKGGENNGEQ